MLLLLVSFSSSLLGCGARLGSAGSVHCSDWVCACRGWGRAMCEETWVTYGLRLIQVDSFCCGVRT